MLALPDGDVFLCGFVGIERSQGGGIGAAFINGHHFGLAVVADYLTKETQQCNVEWSTTTPRSAIISSRLRRFKVYRLGNIIKNSILPDDALMRQSRYMRSW